MKRYYFTTESKCDGECDLGDHLGNIRGARTKAQAYANAQNECVYINDCDTCDIVDVMFPDEEEPEIQEGCDTMKVRNIQFKNKTHSERYQELMKKMLHDNVYYRAVAYLLALNDDCYKHISSMFNIEKGRISFGCINEAWQTSSSLRVTRLIYNLWNGYCYDESDDEDPPVSSDYTVSEIFYDSDARYYFEAVKLRYPEMFHRVNLEERTVQIRND